MCISSLVSGFGGQGDASINLLTSSLSDIDLSFLVTLINILELREEEKTKIKLGCKSC